MVLFVILDLHRPWSLFTFKGKEQCKHPFVVCWGGCTIPLKVQKYTKENEHTHTHTNKRLRDKRDRKKTRGTWMGGYADKADGHGHLCSWLKFRAQLFLGLSLVAVKCCAKTFYKSKGEE